jgi:hypothetical protein
MEAEARYLGPYLHTNNMFDNELARRLHTMCKLWWIWRKFFHGQAPLKVKKLIFKAIVVSSVLACVISYVLADKHYVMIQAAVSKLARRVLAGRATTVNPDGGKVTLTNIKVLSIFHLAPIHIEIAVLRIKFYQAIAKEPEHHLLFLGVMFGKLVNVVSEPDSPHPHLQQLVADVRYLEFVENWQNMLMKSSRTQLCCSTILVFRNPLSTLTLR